MTPNIVFHYIERSDMIEIDRIMVEDLKIPVSMMMEHAGLHLAKVVAQYFKDFEFKSILVIIGSGNNGGGGLVAARRLTSWNLPTKLYLHKGEPRIQLLREHLLRTKLVGSSTIDLPDLVVSEEILVVDAYIGYNYQSPVSTEDKQLFDFLRKSKVISLDIPSGMDSSSGVTDSYLNPLATVTLAWPKYAFSQVEEKYIGKLYLADIGVPQYIFDEMIDLTVDDPVSEIYNCFKFSSLLECKFRKDGWELVKNAE